METARNSAWHYGSLTCWAGVILLVAGCGSTSGLDRCNEGASRHLDADNCLVFNDSGQLSKYRSQIDEVVRETVSAVNEIMPVDNVLIRVVADASQAIPEIGLSGYNPGREEVVLYFDPESSMLPVALETDLTTVLAHELHHAKRRRSVGYGSTLFEAVITEGMADHFAMEITGAAPPIWSTALSGDDLDIWTSSAMEIWMEDSYDHRAWFLGTSPAIPRWAGYAIGFDLVRSYLSYDSSRRASLLVDEPAMSLLPSTN